MRASESSVAGSASPKTNARFGPRMPTGKSFLLLFFKKEGRLFRKKEAKNFCSWLPQHT
jgi:hypothetical protein